MIFLSASVPKEGRKYYETRNVPAIREAIMAFTKVCAELKIPFVFGGHPAITPMIYSVAKSYDEYFTSKITIYQSKEYENETPKEVEYYENIVWTEKCEDRKQSTRLMREQMLSNKYECGVFIGGMEGVVEEAFMFHSNNPDAIMLSIPNTGGAAAALQEEPGLDIQVLRDSYAYASLLRDFFKEIYDIDNFNEV